MTRKTAILVSLIVAIISATGMFALVERERKKIDFVYVFVTTSSLKSGEVVNQSLKKVRVSAFDVPRAVLSEDNLKQPLYARFDIPENTIISPQMLTSSPNTRNVTKGYTTVLVPVDHVRWNRVRPNDYVSVFAIAKLKEENAQTSIDTPSVITVLDKARVVNVWGNDGNSTFEINKDTGSIKEKPASFVELEVTLEDAARMEWYIEVAKIAVVKIPD